SQKDRIKSSIVYPVLSPKNELMGTIVLHCDKSSFFKKEDKQLWSDILELYAKEIAREKVMLDNYSKLHTELKTSFDLEIELPF
ncbi:MAG: hypothetical protein JXR56_06855, partial [Candidatus Cloacimonetes bacterium]|nr:hypothetical protein [Candidatus Cloacimonadota bacterium]